LPDEDPTDGPESPEKAGETALASDSAASKSPLADALEPAPGSDAAEAYQQRARLAEDRLAEVLAAYRTLRTENDAFRERTTKNLERRYDQRRERLLLKFIEILDNLDRALDAAEETYAGQPLIEGLIIVRTQLLQTLQEEGLERIPVLGLPYDPNFSEAVETRPVDDPDHHHVVVKELLRGYRLNGRIARASRVVVGQYAGPADTPAETPRNQDERAPAPAPPAKGEDPSLEEIVARAEAHEALFPGDVDDDEGEKDR
jgi:molecular chaperone GrpE